MKVWVIKTNWVTFGLVFVLSNLGVLANSLELQEETLVLHYNQELHEEALELLNRGNRLRLVMELEGGDPLLFDRVLSYSPFVKHYIIEENQKIIAQSPQVELILQSFFMWPVPKNILKNYKKVKVAYLGAYYHFPFSILYLLPSLEPKVRRFSLTL